MDDFFLEPQWYRIIFVHFAVIYSLLQVLRTAPDILPESRQSERSSLWIVAFILTLFCGLRPDTIVLGDLYGAVYERTTGLEKSKDWLFPYLSYGCHLLGFDYHLFFLTCATIYFAGTTYAVQKLFPYRSSTAYAVVIASFSFFAYCVNGVRNGMGCSMFLVALVFLNEKKWKQAALFAIIASGFHNSLWIPIAATIVAYFYDNTKLYSAIWILSILLSLILGDMMQLFLENINVIDTGRTEEYFLEGYGEDVSDRFRWDFLLYSAVPILIGWYFVIKKGYRNQFYSLILNVYILVNSLWVLVNRNWLSNRIAFLSWFLYAFVIMYPILNIPNLKHRAKWISYTVIGNATFTYFMWLIGKYR